jgi:hypothetical protein
VLVFEREEWGCVLWCLTSTADSRLLLWWPTFSVPIVKLPTAFSSQPEGAEAEGAMPSSTPWAKLVAAKKRGASKLVVRIVDIV